jgi:hypothetical protein
VTESQIQRIKDAIRDCDRFIAKREASSRPEEMLELLEWTRQHRVKLLEMLDQHDRHR